MGKFISILLIIIGLCSSCKELAQGPPSIPPEPEAPLNKIMPLGASRVAGDRPNHESFRYDLWKELILNNWSFDFIDTQEDNAIYLPVENTPFDPDHEGAGGRTSDDILVNLFNWLRESGAPDIVLFSSPGGNDVLRREPLERTISNLESIIDILQKANPQVTVIIEKFASGRSSLITPEISNDIKNLHQAIARIATEKTNDQSEIIVVDMYTGFDDDLLADNIHYNDSGAQFIAERYYKVLRNVLKK